MKPSLFREVSQSLNLRRSKLFFSAFVLFSLVSISKLADTPFFPFSSAYAKTNNQDASQKKQIRPPEHSKATSSAKSAYLGYEFHQDVLLSSPSFVIDLLESQEELDLVAQGDVQNKEELKINAFVAKRAHSDIYEVVSRGGFEIRPILVKMFFPPIKLGAYTFKPDRLARFIPLWADIIDSEIELLDASVSDSIAGNDILEIGDFVVHDPHFIRHTGGQPYFVVKAVFVSKKGPYTIVTS